MLDYDISIYDIRLESGGPPAHFDSPWILSLTQIGEGL